MKSEDDVGQRSLFTAGERQIHTNIMQISLKAPQIKVRTTV